MALQTVPRQELDERLRYSCRRQPTDYRTAQAAIRSAAATILFSARPETSRFDAGVDANHVHRQRLRKREDYAGLHASQDETLPRHTSGRATAPQKGCSAADRIPICAARFTLTDPRSPRKICRGRVILKGPVSTVPASPDTTGTAFFLPIRTCRTGRP